MQPVTVATASLQNPQTESPGAPPAKKYLFGRFMLPDTTEHTCQVMGLSLDGATFLSPHIPPGGQMIVAYLEDVGRVEAITANPVAGGFNVLFSLNASRRDRLETRLKWLSDQENQTLAASRRHARFEPKDTKSHITLPDGRIYPCEVVDISLSGAGVKVDVMPSLGTFLMLGKMRGRIVRYLEAGIAIEFVKPLDGTQLDEQVQYASAVAAP
jgi:hypothetical protein